MTTPNEELRKQLQQIYKSGELYYRVISDTTDLPQSQAERIKELEAGWQMLAATEPVLVVEKEPDYWSGGHFHEGSKPHIGSTKVWRLPIGTKLFTRHMPAQDVTELVEALEKLYKKYVNLLESGRDRILELGGTCDPVDVMEMSDPGLRDARTALSKYKGAK